MVAACHHVAVVCQLRLELFLEFDHPDGMSAEKQFEGVGQDSHPRRVEFVLFVRDLDVEAGNHVEPAGIDHLDCARLVQGDESIGALQEVHTEDGRGVGLYLVDQRGDIRIPDTDLVVEPAREKHDQGLVVGQGQDALRVFRVNVLLVVVDGLPEDDLAVHAGRRHELQLGHGDESHDNALVPLLDGAVVLVAGVALLGGQLLLGVGLEVPHADAAVLEPAEKYLVEVVPGHGEHLAKKLLFELLLLVVGLAGQLVAALDLLPAADVPVRGRGQQQAVFLLLEEDDVQQARGGGNHVLLLDDLLDMPGPLVDGSLDCDTDRPHVQHLVADLPCLHVHEVHLVALLLEESQPV